MPGLHGRPLTGPVMTTDGRSLKFSIILPGKFGAAGSGLEVKQWVESPYSYQSSVPHDIQCWLMELGGMFLPSNSPGPSAEAPTLMCLAQSTSAPRLVLLALQEDTAHSDLHALVRLGGTCSSRLIRSLQVSYHKGRVPRKAGCSRSGQLSRGPGYLDYAECMSISKRLAGLRSPESSGIAVLLPHTLYVG